MLKKGYNRFILYFVILILIISGSTLLYIKYGGYLWMDDAEKNKWVAYIKSSPKLSDKFYEIYNLMYPNSLENGQLSYLIKREISSELIECPCRLAVHMSHPGTKLRIGLPQLTFYLENFVTQKECLNYYTSKVDFLDNIIGVEDASKKLFNKNLDTLDDREIIELILIMQNPSYYNKKRRFDILKKEIEIMNQKIY